MSLAVPGIAAAAIRSDSRIFATAGWTSKSECFTTARGSLLLCCITTRQALVMCVMICERVCWHQRLKTGA